MAKLIPEKTVELYTAFALEDTLGRDTWIWSRAAGADQDFANSALRKWFVLELKAPEATKDPYIPIDVKQLDAYRNGYMSRQHPDVLYVLPVPPWRSIPPNPVIYPSWLASFVFPAAAHPSHRWTFRCWSYVIRASLLWQLLDVGRAQLAPNDNPRWLVRVRENSAGSPAVYPADNRRPPIQPPEVPTLHEILWDFNTCIEPRRAALRSAPRPQSDSNLPHYRPLCPVCQLHALETLQRSDYDVSLSESSDRDDDRRGQEPPDDEQDLPLSVDSIDVAMRTLGEGNRGRRLYVGLP